MGHSAHLLTATQVVINKKAAVTLTYSAPTFRGETVTVNGVTYPIYNVYKVLGSSVNATNILTRVLVATTTALTANDLDVKAGNTYTYFIITRTPGSVSSMSNPRSVTITK